MNTISFMSANYFAREVGYNVTEGWMQGDNATNAYFSPLATYAERFGALLTQIANLGFEAVDIWSGHLNTRWATDEHIRIAQELLDRHHLKVVSLATGNFGETPTLFERTCQIAVALKAKILGGGTPLMETDRPAVVALLNQYDLKLGLENHPEKTPEALLERIGDPAGGRVGTAIDTGWFGTQGYDAALALEKLSPVLVHIHLKDVLEVGQHRTCRYGQGCVPIERCVQFLRKSGYSGPISVEHEPDHFNPDEDCKADLGMLRAWMQN